MRTLRGSFLGIRYSLIGLGEVCLLSLGKRVNPTQSWSMESQAWSDVLPL